MSGIIGFFAPVAQKATALILVSQHGTITCMGKHAKTLSAIFAAPTRSNILWSDVESMLKAYAAELTRGKGSRVRIALGGVRAVFHRPHPRKETDKGSVESMRRFLNEAGVRP